jgi:hypothetical protein
LNSDPGAIFVAKIIRFDRIKNITGEYLGIVAFSGDAQIG